MFSSALQEATEIRISNNNKAAFALARRFESDILEALPSPDPVFGSEEGLARQYATSRKTVRQALRILEARSLGRMRRGAGGGLLLHVPDIKEVAAMMAIHLMAIGASVGDVLEARRQLEPVLDNGGAEGVTWARSIFETLLCEFEDAAPDIADTQNRALLIARRIARDCGRSRQSEGDARIDTIEHLAERHATGPQVVLQALRVLEDLELIEVQRGRNGGFVASTPSPAAIVRATYPYFVLSGMSVHCVHDVIWAINKVGASQAALTMARGQAIPLEVALAGLTRQSVEEDAFVSQIAMWRVLADAADNKVLHVLVRCLFYYQMNAGLISDEDNAAGRAEAASFLSGRIARAVLAGNPVAAVDAVSRLEQVSRGGNLSDSAA